MSDETDVPKTKDGDFGHTDVLLEQYKVYLADLGNIGTRFTSMTTYYVSVISALLALLALKEKTLAEIDSNVLYLVCSAGFIISVLWAVNVSYFRNVFRAKLTVLSQMEKSLPFQAFSAEYDVLKQFRVKAWSRIERFVPFVFAAFFLLTAGLRLIHSLRIWCA